MQHCRGLLLVRIKSFASSLFFFSPSTLLTLWIPFCLPHYFHPAAAATGGFVRPMDPSCCLILSKETLSAPRQRKKKKNKTAPDALHHLQLLFSCFSLPSRCFFCANAHHTAHIPLTYVCINTGGIERRARADALWRVRPLEITLSGTV